MNEKELFYQDKETCGILPTHIMAGVTASPLKEIDELYGAADVLSVQNAKKHSRILLGLSATGTLLTFAFLLYDEAEMHGLILACGVLILFLFFLQRFADRLDSHRKYLQYRVLAESLRVQFFLSFAGMKTKISDLLPWSIRKGIPWIQEILEELPVDAPADTPVNNPLTDPVSDPSPEAPSDRMIHIQEETPTDLPEPDHQGKRPVLDCWIRNQKSYHESALKKAEIKNHRDGHVADVVLVVTIASYLAVLLFELVVYRGGPGTAYANQVRAMLKIILGTMSAMTLFTGSYYGKMSLSNVIDDHKRMIALYETAEEEILRDGENEELLLMLAREFLNENSTWYAYQSKNKAELVM